MTWNLSALVVAVSLACGCVTVLEASAADNLPPGLPVALLEAVRADAARRGGIQSSQVRVISAEAVTWPDASMGCPQPGMGYTQALMRGWRLVVDISGVPVRYHANIAGSRWVQCDGGRAQEPVPIDPRS